LRAFSPHRSDRQAGSHFSDRIGFALGAHKAAGKWNQVGNLASYSTFGTLSGFQGGRGQLGFQCHSTSKEQNAGTEGQLNVRSSRPGWRPLRYRYQSSSASRRASSATVRSSAPGERERVQRQRVGGTSSLFDGGLRRAIHHQQRMLGGMERQRVTPRVFRTRVPSSVGGRHLPPRRSHALRRSISNRASGGRFARLPPTLRRTDSSKAFFTREGLKGGRKGVNAEGGRWEIPET